MKFIDDWIKDGVVFVKVVVKCLEVENIVLDIGVYCDVLVGFWIWCGGMVEIVDIEVMLFWFVWVFEVEIVV